MIKASNNGKCGLNTMINILALQVKLEMKESREIVTDYESGENEQ